MLSKLLKLSLLMGGLLALGYFIHTTLFSEALSKSESEFLKFSYLYNLGFSSLLLLNIILFQKKLIELIGFIYLGAIFIKLGLFFFLVKKSEYQVDKSLFLLFSIPFMISLGVELFYLIRELNSANFSKDN